MGFTVIVEVGYEGEKISQLPTHQGGKAVFAFLGVLDYYCIVDEKEDTGLIIEWRKWLNHLQEIVGQPLCDVFKPILGCMWGDGGGIGGDFQENEYEWYLKRNPESSSKMTEDEFREFIRAGKKRWSPIDKMMANVKLLIDIFKTAGLPDIEALFVAEDTIPDFESLYDTLAIFSDFWYDEVRLNFC